MKNMVVYYSYTGNTEVVAKEIHQLVGGELVKIEEVKQRKPGGMMGPALSALLGRKSRLKPMDFTLKACENIFLGTQVWAAHTTPAINAFLNRAVLKGKKVYLFITKADEKIPQAVIDALTSKVEKRGGKVIDSISFTTKYKEVISPGAVKDQVSEWVGKIGMAKGNA